MPGQEEGGTWHDWLNKDIVYFKNPSIFIYTGD